MNSSSSNRMPSLGSHHRPKVVQVLKVHEEMGILIINDKKNSAAVMLSPKCIYSFREMYNGKPLSTLLNSMIKLEKWHFSTAIQCQRSNRDLKTMSRSGILLPVAISCSRITSLGAFDCSIIGDPVDINKVSIFLIPLQIYDSHSNRTPTHVMH